MRCEDARSVLSAALDGETDETEAEARAHLADCAACRAHLDAWERVRRELASELGPDLVAGVLARVAAPARRSPVRRALPVVAAAVAGLIVGATLVGTRPGRGPELVGADIPRRVLAAQSRLDSLAARVEVTERGWHPDVPVRRYSGELSYVAPETFGLHLEDTTRYPAGSWVPNDVDVFVDRATWWTRGPASCPVEAQPRCTSPQPRIRVVTGREPFAEDLPAPLDLILPASSFAIGESATVLDRSRRFDGRDATGVVTTVAQISPLLDTLRLAGNWRSLAPTDGATLWLDRATLVPLAVDVHAPSGTDAPRLEIRLRDVEINTIASGQAPPPPPAPVVRDAGFVSGVVTDLDPGWLPAGMRPYRSGTSNAVAVASWSDGRAWVKVRRTTAWAGGRLFGGLGDVVRPVTLPGRGTAYVAEGGRKVGVHGAGFDVVVTGSVSSADLLHVAGSLPLRGLPVPPGWAEASAASVSTAAGVLSPLLVVRGSEDFAAPSVRVDGTTVTLAYTGAGDRGFVLTQEPGRVLAPPLDAEVVGVRVRGRAGRWTPDVHTLEWVEGGHVVGLRSRSLRLGELVEIASRLRAAP